MAYIPDPITGRCDTFNDGLGKDEGMDCDDWIEQNRPENGLFRAYWKNAIEVTPDNYHLYRKDLEGPKWIGGATLDPEEGEGLRYEWYYKDGLHTDGISKGWWSNGNLKHSWTWKNGEKNGLYRGWYMNGLQSVEGIYKDGICNEYKMVNKAPEPDDGVEGYVRNS